MSNSKPILPERVLDEMNRQHACVVLSGKFCVLSETVNPATGYADIQFSSVVDLRHMYRNNKIVLPVGKSEREFNPADLWLDHERRRQYSGVIFSPNNHNGFDFENSDGTSSAQVSRQVNGHYYNLWKGFNVSPRKGDCSLFKRHVFENVCNRKKHHYRWLMDWLADLIQRPGGHRPGTAVVLRGNQGTGKGVFTTNVGKILGPHFVHVSGQHRLTGRFNNHLKAALLVFVDEGFWAGDKRDAGTLKAMITEDFMLVEPKFQDAFQLRNHIRVVMASNSSWVVPADLQERRFFVLDVSPRRMQDTRYFGAIQQQMNSGGREALLYELLNRKITSDLKKAPRTQALFEQMLSSMDVIEAFWFSALFNQRIGADSSVWPSVISCNDFYSAFLQWCTQRRERHPPADSVFFRGIHKVCPDIRPTRPTDDHGGRYRAYELPQIAVCRRRFEEKINIEGEVWQDEQVIPF